MSVGFDHMDLHELKARNIKVEQNTNTLQIDQLINSIQNYIVNVFFGFSRSDSLRTY
jgi:hypothetical protein